MKHTTPDLMKFKKLMRRLNVSRITLMGMLESLWIATQKSAPRGDIGKFDDEEIAVEMEWPGDPAELVDALVECGWLDRSSVHRLIVHHWHDHAPKYIKGLVSRQGGFVSEIDVGNPTLPTYVANERNKTNQKTPNVANVRDQQPNLTKPNPTKPNDSSDAQPAASALPAPAVDQNQQQEVFCFLLSDGRTWTPPAAKIAEYRQSFPGLRLDAELRAAVQWCRDNPAKRKSAADIERFVGGWLIDATQKGRVDPASKPREKRAPPPEKVRAARREAYRVELYKQHRPRVGAGEITLEQLDVLVAEALQKFEG